MPFISFDLIGTLFTFDSVVNRIEQVFELDKKEATRFFEYWYRWAEVDYVGSSHGGRYKTLKTVLRSTLERSILCYFETPSTSIDVEVLMKEFETLTVNPTAIKTMETILTQEDKWEIWILSPFGYQDTVELLTRVNLIHYVGDNLICCDDLNLSKPHPKIYSELMRMAVHKTKRIENFYMIGASGLDLAGAKNVSMRTIFLNSVEKQLPSNLYQPPDMIGSHLLDCTYQMIQFEKTKKYL